MLLTTRNFKYFLILFVAFSGMILSPEHAYSAIETINHTKKNIIIASSKLQFSKAEQQWLAAHPKIRIGAMDSWPPMSFVDQGGASRGIDAGFIGALNRRLNNSVKIVSGSWTDIYNGVKEKKLDGLLGITRRPEREEFFNFTRPYVSIPHAIFAKKDSRYLDNLDDLRGKKVGAERGFFIVKLLQTQYPDIEVKEYSSTSDVLDALSIGEIDAYVGNRAVASYIIESEIISNIKAYGKINETSSTNSIGVRKDQLILRNILQKVLDDISQEERHIILAKWDFYKNTGLAKIVFSAKEKKWLEKHKVIRVAFDENYPPYSFRNEKGEFVGIAVDYARELAKRIGVAIEIYPEGQWQKLYAAAQQREVDVIATLVKLEPRKEWFYFTKPYISLAQYIITSKENMQSINLPEHLAGRKVALIKNYSMTKIVLNEVNNIQPYYVNDLTEALEAVSTGKAEATIGAIGTATHLIGQTGLLNLGFSALYSKGQSEQRFGVRNDWPELSSILDKALRTLSDRDVINIFGRWTQSYVTEAEAQLFDPVVKLNNQEREWLAKHPVIRTASDPNWAPIEFTDEKGEHKGISAEYIKLLEDMLGIKFEVIKDQSWVEMVDNFKKGEIDLFTSINRTPGREDFIEFTDSYTQYPMAIFGAQGTQFILDMEELNGQKVAVVKGYATQELLESNYPNINLVEVPDPVSGLDLLSSGEIDAYVGNILVTNHYIAKSGYTHIKIVGKTPFQYKQSMGVRQDWPMFVSILNKALNAIPELEKNEIYNQWIGVRYEHGFDYGLLWKALIVVIFLFFIFIYWNHKLSILNKQLTVARNLEKSARELVENSNKKLQEVDKLKSMFIASMSHELRTPLNSIIGFSGILLQEIPGPLNDTQKDTLQRVSRAGSHLLGLISDIIDISKIEAGHLDFYSETFSLKDVIDEAVESIRPLVEDKEMSIEVKADSWPELTTDRARLLQCLLNYLSNAVKYSEHGTITLSSMVDNETLNISVTDTGIGIPEKDLPKLFDAFERLNSILKAKAGGTGLGLYLTKKITEELLQGKVSVKSQLGEGSTFSMAIPMKVSG